MRTSVKTLAAGTLAAATFLIAPAAIASDSTATVEVTPGVLSITPGAADLADVQTTNDTESTTGAMTLAVDDATGTDDGWSIHQQLSGGLTNAATGQIIPASNLTVTGVSNVVKTTGRDITALVADAEALTTGASIDLGAGGAVLTAAAGEGEGNYTAVVGLSLTVPAYSSTGTYTGTLVTTNSPQP